jgi:hypothetical protein
VFSQGDFLIKGVEIEALPNTPISNRIDVCFAARLHTWILLLRGGWIGRLLGR